MALMASLAPDRQARVSRKMCAQNSRFTSPAATAEVRRGSRLHVTEAAHESLTIRMVPCRFTGLYVKVGP